MLAICLQKIEDKLGWGPSAEWSTKDFMTLSEAMMEETGIQLSHTTLKRVWGRVQYQSSPNPTTLDALAQFLGYENWRNFVAGEKMNTASPPPAPEVQRTFIGKSPKLIFPLIGSLLLVSSIAFVLAMSSPDNSLALQAASSEATFYSQPVTTGLPNTVVFHYDVGTFKGKQYQIQQSWDPKRRFDVDPDGHEASSIYYYPGYYRAKLVVDNHILAEHDLYIRTDGWMATINSTSPPRYLYEDELVRANKLGISSAVIADIEQNPEAHDLTYAYIKDFGEISSDHAELLVTLKNTFKSGRHPCQKTEVHLICSQGLFIVPLSIPGCTGDIRCMFSEVYLTSDKKDLSRFGANFDDWQTIRLSLKDLNALVFLNDQLALSQSYTKGAGKVVGVRIRFSGMGEVKEVQLKDKNGEVFFEDAFLTSDTVF